MHGAAFALLVNTALAGLFSASFVIIALANPACRKALWFGASYGIGMLTPLSLFIMPYSPAPAVFGALNYVTFSAGLLMMSAALARFYQQNPRWIAILCLFLASLASGWLIHDWPKTSLAYNLIYQTPFAVAALISAGVIVEAGQCEPLEIALAGLYGLMAFHFIVKAFLAASFNTDQPLNRYAAGIYALISQSLTGILLIAAGLLTLLIVAQSAIADARDAADTDPLTGLLNRRGFDLRCESCLSKRRSKACPATVLLIDLDHFKQINDRHGHETGDKVLKYFAARLQEETPQDAVVGRMGGEEFVVFLNGATLETAHAIAETVRSTAAQSVRRGLPAVTASIGIACIGPAEPFSATMRRADKAMYQAKASGRDQVCVAG